MTKTRVLAALLALACGPAQASNFDLSATAGNGKTLGPPLPALLGKSLQGTGPNIQLNDGTGTPGNVVQFGAGLDSSDTGVPMKVMRHGGYRLGSTGDSRNSHGSQNTIVTPINAWIGSTAYALNAYVTHAGTEYQVTTAGTSAATGGPTGTGTGITDGSVTWSSVAAPAPAYVNTAQFANGVPQWVSWLSGGYFAMPAATGPGTTAGIVLPSAGFVFTGGSGYTAGSTTITFPSTSGAGGCTNNGQTSDLPVFTPVITSGVITGVTLSFAGTATLVTCSQQMTLTAVDSSSTPGSGFTGWGLVTPGGTWAGSGATTAQILTLLASTCADGNQIETVFAGANDPFNSIAYPQTVANLQAYFDGLQRCGKFVVIASVAPRLQANFSPTNKGAGQAAVDQWALDYARGYAYANPNGLTNVMYLPTGTLWADGTSTAGGWVTINGGTNPSAGPNGSPDGQHQGDGAAFAAGLMEYHMLQQAFGVPAGKFAPVDQTAVYDATYNPYGVLNTNASLTGTTGTNSTTGCTGSVPTGFTMNQSNAYSSGGSCVLSQDTSNSDGITHSRFVITYSNAGGAAGSNQYKVSMYSSTGIAAGGANTIQAGDHLRAAINVEVSGSAAMNQLNLSMKCTDSSASPGPYTDAATQAGQDIQVTNYTADYFFPSTDPRGMTAQTPFRLVTPPGGFVVPAGCTKVSPTFFVGWDATNAAAAGVVKIDGFAVYKEPGPV